MLNFVDFCFSQLQTKRLISAQPCTIVPYSIGVVVVEDDSNRKGPITRVSASSLASSPAPARPARAQKEGSWENVTS